VEKPGKKVLLPLPIGQFFQIHGNKLMFAEAISQALTRSDPDFAVCRAESPSDTVRLCRSMAAYAVIMEVTAYTPWRLAERLALRDEIKKRMPVCKVVLLVDEKSDAAPAAATAGMRPTASTAAAAT
jgi:DNA-binding NarL/FixJ family response regulator